VVAAEPNNLLGIITNSAGVEAGLCVHIGSTDGAVEIQMVCNGRRLVHGLAFDDQSLDSARKAIQAEGLYPLASVEKARTRDQLPYADNLVSLLIADLDAVGKRAPSRKEMMRVVRPSGVACLKKDGKWTAITKPRPKEMDEWTHFDYDAGGNAVSHDRLVGPPTLPQWTSGVQPIKLGGNPAGFIGSPGVRLANGRAISEWVVENRDKKTAKNYLGAWDAFSGIPLWTIEKRYRGTRRPMHLAAVGNRIYTYLEEDSPLTALDAATGKVILTYDKAGHLPENTGTASFRIVGDRLLVAHKNALYLLNASNGDIIWKYEDEHKSMLLFPTISVKAQKVFVLASDIDEDYKIEHRWPNAPATAVVCLKFATGNVVWRNTEVAGKHIGQLIYNNGYLALFGPGGIGAGKDPFTGCIRIDDAKLLWTGTFPTTWNRAGYVMLWRDGRIYYADPWKIFTLDPETGKETHVYGGSYNGRCTRFCATDDYFIYSLVTYVDKDFAGTIQSITRSACANSAFPANGMLYFTPTACGCTTMLRGHIALTPEPLGQPIDDSLRLEAGVIGRQSIAPAKPFALPDSLIAQDWRRQARAPENETEPVTVNGRTFIALTHEHQMQCRDSQGQVLWSFTTGGRISSPPVIYEGLCLFGSQDGWVYAVRVADGSLAWRFMAAPYERKMIADSQLESSWPVYGVVMHKGLLCASAGLHPELGGGIYLYGLEPATGKMGWKRMLSKSPAIIRATERTDYRIVPSSALNDILRSDGNLLSLPAGRDQRFTFDPQMPDAELKQKLQTNPPAKH